MTDEVRDADDARSGAFPIPISDGLPHIRQIRAPNACGPDSRHMLTKLGVCTLAIEVPLGDGLTVDLT